MFPNAFVSLAILFSVSCFLCIKADENEKIRKQWMDVNSQRIIKEYLERFKVFVDYVLENGSREMGKNYSTFSLTASRVLVTPAANAAGDTDLKPLLSDNDAVLNYIAGQLDALNELTGNNIGTIINKDDLPTVWKAVTLDVSYIINDIRIRNMPNIRLPTK
ncbi:hypothetical protein Ddc_13708 [Ditylenchus destructor]|nr:hypothetical protein Ddc_13708 [Ditylenchus destructor]